MSENPKHLKIKDFTYNLPADRIAKFPLSDRDASKLLYYNKGKVQDENFTSLPNLLPPNSLLVFNNTKVVQARLIFKRPTGSSIEIFCLEPVAPTSEMQLAMGQQQSCLWKCLVGNAKRWKESSLELPFSFDEDYQGILKIEKKEKLADSYLIHFSWEPNNLTFAEILQKVGNLPLPPYLNRLAIESDKQTYQTIFAEQEGAVAAPTAGLHFTNKVLADLRNRNIEMLAVTLHVGAGTFKPVKADEMAGHTMHGEEIYVSVKAIKQLFGHLPQAIIPVGTTSLRTLESVYWLGVSLLLNFTQQPSELHVSQWLPYEIKEEIAPVKALETLINYAELNQLDNIRATTQLLIAPGYKFRLICGLITNFHQPESTLLLLVSALIGEDWRQVYQHALENQYRFLSYGDSSLLIP